MAPAVDGSQVSRPQTPLLHVSPAAHLRPQVPQLFTSVLSDVQLCEQQVPVPPPIAAQVCFSVAAVQVSAMQLPALQVRPVAQTLPQRPQFWESVAKSLQPLPGQQAWPMPPSVPQNFPFWPGAQVAAA